MAKARATSQNRKLQMSGGSTYVISLPKTWVEQMGLQAGDGVSMTRNGNRSITVFPRDGVRDSGRAVATIGPKDSDESIRRKIVAMYLSGYKSIKMVARGIRLGPGQINTIRNFARSSMIGTEIVESDPECITMQTLTRLPELTFETALRRMRTMAIDMHREALEALKNGDRDYAEEVVRLDDEIDRFTFYMLRNLTMAVSDAGVLREMSLDNPSDCLYWRTVMSRTERIADHAALIAKRVKYLSGPLDPLEFTKASKLSRDFVDVFEMSVDALISSDYQMAEQVCESVSKIARMQEDMMVASAKDASPNAVVLKFVLESIRRSAEYTLDIAEVVMDRNVRNVLECPEGPPRTVHTHPLVPQHVPCLATKRQAAGSGTDE